MTLRVLTLARPLRLAAPPFALALAAVAGVSVAIDPARGILVFGGGLAMAMAALFPEVATFTFVVAIYANVPAVIAHAYGVPEILAAASVGLLGFPLIRTVVMREPFVATPTLFAVLGYVCVTLLSAALAAFNAGERVGIVLTEGLLLFLLLTNAIRSPAGLRRAIWGLLLAGALMSVVTIHQALTDNYQSDYGGFAVVEEGFTVDVGGEGQDVKQARAAGPVGEKNRYAQVLLVLLPLGIGRIKDAGGIIRQAAAAAMTTLILIAIVLTYSRGGVIAVAVVLAAAALLRFVRLRTLLVGGMVLVLSVVLFASTFAERVASIGGAADLLSDTSDEAEGAIVGRATSNLAALHVLWDHPVIGVGPGLYGEYYSVLYANRLGLRHFEEPRRAHNLFLEVGAETGLLGLGAFVAVLVTTGLGLWSIRRRWASLNVEHANLATAMLLALVGYLTAGLFLHLAYERYLWLLLALASSTVWILTPRIGMGPASSGPVAQK
jgi:O-antigen ligase